VPLAFLILAFRRTSPSGVQDERDQTSKVRLDAFCSIPDLPEQLAHFELATNKLIRKYPQFKQDEIFGLQDAFRKLDVGMGSEMCQSLMERIPATEDLHIPPF
jgi:hypothetical protein